MEEYNNVQRLGESRNEIYWIVYQTTNLINNKIYIGVHKTKNPHEFDGYIGNGCYVNQPNTYMYAKTHFQAALKKYGVKNFKRITLQIFNNEEEAYAEEARLVDKDFLSRSDVYNMVLGGNLPPEVKIYQQVHQYDLNGNYIKTFDSFESAAKEVNRKPSSISDACGNNLSMAKYYWSKTKIDKLNLEEYHQTKKLKKIYMYSVQGEFIKEFDSTRSTGYSQASQSAILGNLVDGKYYFCYVKADNYSKARDSYMKSRTIYQYDDKGNFIKEWKYLEASKQFQGINQAIRLKKLTKDGFYWGLQQYDVYNKPIVISKKKIAKYDLEGNLIKVYENSSECYKENGKSVYKNLVGLRKTYKNHIYKYIS